MKHSLWILPALALTLLACPPTGVVCKPGTLPCGTGCIDPTSDRRNCGACGTTCGSQQDCMASECQCRTGTQACPDGTCAVLEFDAKNCGACGVTCAAGEVCEQRVCKSACSAGLTRCGDSCLDAQTDESNCGACGNECAQGQQCKAGVCDYEAVAACYWSGHLRGFDPATGVTGPLSDVGTNPGALAKWGTTVLSADGMDQRLYQGVAQAGGAYGLGRLGTRVGNVPNQVIVDRPYVYVVNAGTGTLQVLSESSDAGVLTFDAGVDGALRLGTVAEISLGMNSYPEGAAKVGNVLYLPLYGGAGAAAADAGQDVARIDVTDPTMPVAAGRITLKNLDLKPFDGGSPVARPWAIVARNGQLYVALNNLNPDTYAAEGPGMVAKIDPTSGVVTGIDLGAADCLNPQWLAPVGTGLAVSCGGKVNYTMSFAVESVTAAGLVLLDAQDTKVATWSSASTCTGLDAGCMPMMPGRFAVVGNQVLLSDQNGGRVVVLEVADGGVREVRGGSNALSVCPVNAMTGVANVADIVSR